MILYNNLRYINTQPLYQKEFAVPDLVLAGVYNAFVTPKSYWYNGATYVVGYESFSNAHQAKIIKYKDGVLTSTDVGTGTSPVDPLDHSFPSVVVCGGGFIYVAQVDGHGYPINLWRSNVAESIEDGFSLVHRISGDFGYNHMRFLPDDSITIYSRKTLSNPNQYGAEVAYTNGTDYTDWTVTIISSPNHASTNIRHYPTGLNHIGTNTWQYYGVSFRIDVGGSGRQFAQAILKTQDNITFYNITESFNKNVVSSGVLTNAELEANFITRGSISATSDYTAGVNAVVINDEIYNSYYNPSDSKYYFEKYNSSGVLVIDKEVPLTDILVQDSAVTPIQLIYNGSNFVVVIYRFTAPDIRTRSIYSCDLNFDNLTHRADLPEVTGTYDRKAFPYNLQDIAGTYIIGGGEETDTFLYQELNTKFQQ